MKKYILLLVSSFLVFLCISPIHANTLPINNITPYTTSYGDGGVSKIEIHDNRTRAWWYARPKINSSYQFSGTVHITLTNGKTLTRVVSGNGKSGQSVSGSVYVSGRIRKVKLFGVAYGSGGISIVIPGVETHNHSGGGSGMNLPIPKLVYEK